MADTSPVRVGVVGCGNISCVYIGNLVNAPETTVVACADLLLERAQERAAEFGVARACTVEELLADPAVEIVLNITIPVAHADISMRALEAGKHVYSEKPLAIEREDGRRILETASRKNLLVGCAPDTFFGDGLQTTRHLIDDGAIGHPIGASAFVMSRGVETWHPDPDFFYQRGGGPLFDMGPYHLTALAMLLGPIRRVSSFSRVTFAERTITSAPRRGARISVTTPTHVAGIMDFASGAVGTLIASFDVWSHGLPDIEIYGSEGSLQVPDPNFFRGPVKLRREGWRQWVDVTSDSQYRTDRRGLGLADMATALRSGGSYRATGRLAYHVLDTMHAFYDSSESGRHIELESTVERPESLPLNLSLAGAMSGDPWLQRFWRRSPPA